MMTKMKSPRMAAFKSFMMLPLVAFLLMAYANPQLPVSSIINSENGEFSVSGTILSSQNGKPLAGAAIVVKGTTTGTLSDQAGNYKIKVAKNAELAVSFVGYTTQLIQVNGNSVINVQMNPEAVVIDLEKSQNPPQREETVNENKKEESYVIVEEAPSFPGGNEAILKIFKENIQYPADAKASIITGKVFVQLSIDKDGNTKDVKILRGVYPSIDKEALRLAALLEKWNPGKQNGKGIECKVTLPVDFKL